jgi:rod shape-determining protein MreC
MRRNAPSNRGLFFFMMMFMCSCLIMTSTAGLLASVEGIASTPLYFIADFFSTVTRGANNTLQDLQQLGRSRQRIGELEEALARSQAELVQLREVASDAQRLADLLEYRSAFTNQETITAEVIAYDPNALTRTIIINRGSRDGLTPGMPVTTQLGLVGQITDVTATAARVLLVTDPSNNVSARLQTSRAQGTVIGLLSGSLRLELIPLDETVDDGDIVITSGLGGDFPADIPIGQVTSSSRESGALTQTAELRPLVNFDQLEFVLVVTSFQPVDISAFD